MQSPLQHSSVRVVQHTWLLGTPAGGNCCPEAALQIWSYRVHAEKLWQVAGMRVLARLFVVRACARMKCYLMRQLVRFVRLFGNAECLVHDDYGAHAQKANPPLPWSPHNFQPLAFLRDHLGAI